MKWPRKRETLVPADAETVAIIVANVALAGRLDEHRRKRLVGLTNSLIDSKRWEATGDLALTPDVVVTIAANAAIPILELQPWVYRNAHWIVVHPSTTVSRGLRSGPASGTVDDEPLAIVGSASPQSGPLTFSWETVLQESRNPDLGRNVVIHEFAHKIDMADGFADGVPPSSDSDAAHWSSILAEEFERLEIGPTETVLGPYAWASPAEFFAVASELFFCKPGALRSTESELYRALADFYRQDPAGETAQS